MGRLPRARPAQQGADAAACSSEAGRRRAPTPIPSRRLVGDYFAAGMDEAAIAAAGAEPLRPYLDRDRRDRLGRRPPRPEPRPPSRRRRRAVRDRRRVRLRGRRRVHLVYVGQGGLGLPERELLPQRRRAARSACATAYAAHVAAQLAEPGRRGGRRGGPADAILAFERRLAEASLSPEQRRDPKLTLNRVQVAALDDVMPRYRLGALPARVGVTSDTVSVDSAAFFTALDGVLADTPVDTLRDVLRWHLVRAYRVLPAAGVRRGELRVLRADPRWPAGAAAALEAGRRRARPPTSARRVAQLFVRRDVPARGEGPRARRWSSTCCPPWAGRSAATRG